MIHTALSFKICQFSGDIKDEHNKFINIYNFVYIISGHKIIKFIYFLLRPQKKYINLLYILQPATIKRNMIMSRSRMVCFL